MLEPRDSTLLKPVDMVSLKRCRSQSFEKELSIRKEKLSKKSKIRDKTTSQKKIKKQKTSSTQPIRSKKLGTRGNKIMI